MEMAEGVHRRLDVILLTGRHSARGEQEVVVAAPGGQCIADYVEPVGQDTHIGDGAAEPLGEARDDIAVGIIDAALAQRRARLVNLVAGREDRHPKPPEHRERGPPDRGGKADILRPQGPAGGQDRRAGRDILARLAPVRAPPDPGRHNDDVAVDATVFLHEHGVGARRAPRAPRHGSAGKDPDCLAVPGGAAERVPRGGPAGAGQPRPGIGTEVVEEHRIAIDRGVVMRRHGPLRDDGFRQNAPVRCAQADGLGLGDGMRDALKVRQRLGRRSQRAAEGEAVVTELCHEPASIASS